MFIQRVKTMLFVRRELKALENGLKISPIPFLIGEIGSEVLFVPDSSYFTKKGKPVLIIPECLLEEKEERDCLVESLARAMRQYWQYSFLPSEYKAFSITGNLDFNFLTSKGFSDSFTFRSLDSRSWARWYMSDKNEDYKGVPMDSFLRNAAGGEQLDKEKFAQLITDRYLEFK